MNDKNSHLLCLNVIFKCSIFCTIVSRIRAIYLSTWSYITEDSLLRNLLCENLVSYVINFSMLEIGSRLDFLLFC
jgi:hypothetical protein